MNTVCSSNSGTRKKRFTLQQKMIRWEGRKRENPTIS